MEPTQIVFTPHSKTGLFDMPAEQYHAIPAVSKTLLGEFADCPIAAYEYLTNARRDSRTLAFGRLVHLANLEPHKVRTFIENEVYIRPDTYPKGDQQLKWNGNSNWCKDWLKSHQDRVVLTSSDLAETQSIVEALSSNKKASSLFKSGKAEQSIFANDPVTGLPMKCRPDWLGDGYIVDIKTCADASNEGFSKAIANLRYHVQAAIYIDVCELAGIQLNSDPSKRFAFVAAQKVNTRINVRWLTESAIELGRQIYKREIEEFADCLESNSWPDYSGEGDEIQTIDVPAYAYSKAEAVLSGATELLEYAN